MSDRKVLRVSFGIILIIGSVIMISVSLNLNLQNVYYDWILATFVWVPFLFGVMLFSDVVNAKNVKRIAEILILIFAWSLIFLVPLEGDTKNYAVSVSGLFVFACYAFYSRKARLKRSACEDRRSASKKEGVLVICVF